MLKWIAGLVAGATLLTVGTLSALAASQGNRSDSSQSPQVYDAISSSAPYFVDADNNGVCDNLGTNASGGYGQNYVDADNNGVCDNRGTNASGGYGQNYVDADNDGVCDNLGTGGGSMARNGRGNGNGNGNGNGYRAGQGR